LLLCINAAFALGESGRGQQQQILASADPAISGTKGAPSNEENDALKQVTKIQTAFEGGDEDADGTLSLSEFQSVFSIEDADKAKEIFSRFDKDANGKVDRKEFAGSYPSEEDIADIVETQKGKMFNLADKNGDGMLSATEISVAAGEDGTSPDDIMALDTDGDGKISREEFVRSAGGAKPDEKKKKTEEARTITYQGVRVAVMNLPHEPMPKDYERIGVEVARSAKESHLALDASTQCICRLLSQVRCECMRAPGSEKETGGNTDKEKEEANMPPSAKAERDDLKRRMSKILEQIRRKHSRKTASKLWGEAENEKMSRMREMARGQELLSTYWRNESARAEAERAEKVAPDIHAWMAARSKHLKELAEKAKAAAEDAAAAAAGDAAANAPDELKAQAKMRSLELAAGNLLRKRSEIQRLKDSLELLRESNAKHAEEIQSDQERRNALQENLAKALEDAKNRIAEALAKLKAMYESMISNACGKPCADLLAQIRSLQAELKDLEGKIGGVGGEDASLEKMMERLRALIHSEEEALERMEREQSTPCATDADCEFGERCHDASNLCALVLEGSECMRHGQCGNGQLCKDRKCLPAPTGEGDRCRMPWIDATPDDETRNVTTCALGQRCILGHCRLHFRGSPCRYHSYCGYGQSCLKGGCEWIPLTEDTVSCDSSEECGPGSKCSDGKCDVVRPGSSCKTVSDCGNAMRCLSDRCQMTDPPEGTVCAVSSDCGPGQGCVDGVCTSHFEGTRCPGGDADCGFGQRCEGGLCHTVDSGESCDGENSCGNGMRCADDANICIGEKAEGSVCRDSEECRFGQTCSGLGLCITVGLNAACIETSNCGKGMVCDSGFCAWPNGGAMALNGGCGEDKDCVSTQVCVAGTCGDVPVEYDTCSEVGKIGWADAKCGRNQRCAAGLCSPTYSLNAPKGGALCKRNDDCANGQRCHPKRKRCEDMFGKQCEATDDCGLNQHCNAGQCVTDGVPCDNAGDCVDWQTCIGGRCGSIAVDAPCEWVADCGNKMVCESSKCVEAPRGDDTSCSDDEPCSDGFTCDASIGVCTFLSVSTPCDADVECARGQSCVSGLCMWRTPPDGSPCDDFSNCGHGQRCDQKKCTYVDIGSTCGVDGETASLCGNGQMCRDGKCADVPQGSVCDPSTSGASAACGAHQKCTDARKCLGEYHRVGLVLDGSPCKEARECGDAQICRLGRCQTVAPGSMCNEESDCGNGQRCGVNASHVCVAFKIGTACEASASTCGNNMRCVDSQCVRTYGFDALDMHMSTAPYAKCFTHIDCAFGYRCVDEKCSPVSSGSSCASNGDCGNGERCSSKSNQCEVVEERTKCRAPSDCANGQICDRGECRGVYGRGLAADIKEGSKCAAHSDCGAMQRCERFRCFGVPSGLQCLDTAVCGNGQMCGESGSCDTAREGLPCKSSDMCGLSQTCLKGLCRGEYGRMLDIEMHQRMSEDWTMQDEWQRLIQARIKNLQSQVTEELHINATVRMSTAQAVLKLREERKKLEVGRKSLEAELERRVNWASPSDGSEEWESLFAKAQDDIAKLEKEIVRLKADLLDCRTNKDKFVPTCEDDLTFQIGKLEEEVARRKAQLEVELQRIKREIQRLRDALNECTNRPGNCPIDEEQRLKLQLMNAERELERREGASSLQDKLTMFRCLYTMQSQGDATVAEAAKLTLTATTLREACSSIVDSKKVSDGLRKCLCSAQQRKEELSAKISAQAAESAALDRAVSTTKQREKEAEASAEAAAKEWTAEEQKEFLWDAQHMDLGDNFQNSFESLEKKYPELAAEVRAKILSKRGIESSTASVATFTPEKLNECTESLPQALKESARSALKVPKENTCNLLSMAGNKLMSDLYACLCPSS